MAERAPEFYESAGWENNMLWQARELLLEGPSACFKDYAVIESSFDRLVLRSGDKNEHNLYCFIEDCDAGILLRSVSTFCTESKDRIVEDVCALISGSGEHSKVLYRKYIAAKQFSTRIDPPDHDIATLLQSVRSDGQYMNYDMSRAWAEGLSCIVDAQMSPVTPPSQRNGVLGGFVARITGPWFR